MVAILPGNLKNKLEKPGILQLRKKNLKKPKI